MEISATPSPACLNSDQPSVCTLREAPNVGALLVAPTRLPLSLAHRLSHQHQQHQQRDRPPMQSTFALQPTGTKGTSGTASGPRQGRFSRSFYGCALCKQRRKKCDEQRPKCTSCVRLKQPCHYPVTRFKQFEPLDLDTSAPASDEALMLTMQAADDHLAPPLQLDIGTVAVRLCQDIHPSMEHAVSTPNLPGPWTAFSLLDGVRKDSTLHSICEAFALQMLAGSKGDSHLLDRSLMQYSKCLKQVSFSLGRPHQAISVELMATVLLMVYFELMIPNGRMNSNYAQHFDGLRILLEELPVEVLFNPRLSKLIRAAKSSILMDYFHRGRSLPDPAVRIAWDESKFTYFDVTEREMYQLLVETNRFNAKAIEFKPLSYFADDATSLARTNAKMQELRVEAEALVDRHLAWECGVPEQWQYSFVKIQADPLQDQVDAPVWRETMTMFPTLEIAASHIAFQMSKLAAFGALFRYWAWRRDVYDVEARLSQPQMSAGEIEAQIEAWALRCNEVADFFAYSIPYFVGASDAEVRSKVDLPRSCYMYGWSPAFLMLRLETIDLDQARWFRRRVDAIMQGARMPHREWMDFASKVGLLTRTPLFRPL